MTANELANELTKMFRGEEYDRLIHEIPDMLRQQEDELNEAGHMICMLRWEIEQLQDRLNEFLVARDLAILRKASEK
jgi:hypothetical protein